jgi:2-dehydropantoate 2-reductase
MGERLRIGVMGAGSIGCYVGGSLLTRGSVDVVFIGRSRLRDEIAAHGLTVRDEDHHTRIAGDRVRYETDPAALADCPVVLCCVKSAQTEEVAATLDDVLAADAVVVSLQNGLRNAPTLRAGLGQREVLAGIVSFNVVSLGDGLFERTMSGPIITERSQDPRVADLVAAMTRAGIPVEQPADIAPHQWSKLLVNLNNSVVALSGAPTRELLLDPGYRRILADIIEEGVEVLGAAGIEPAKVRGLPPRWAPKMLRLPTWAVRLFARAQLKVSAEARSSMYEDLVRGRLTEVDYLNGEIVSLAEEHGADAPINRRVCELVHGAERAGAGSPALGASELGSQLRGPS